MKILILLYCICVIFIQGLCAQKTKCLIKGVIKNAETNESLAGTNISVIGTHFGDAADEYGNYELVLEPGTYSLKFEMIGFQSREIKNIELKEGQNQNLNIYLIQEAMEYGETIEVIGERSLSKEPVGSAMNISRLQVEGRVGAFEDATRTLQTMPGVVTPTDFSGKMFVRGGRTQENVVMVDRIYVYEAYHLGGLSSIFNPDLIDNIEFYAGGFPARYGQAMSAIIEVYNRYGRRGEIQGSFSSSFVSLKMLVEGGLSGDRGSYLVSARVNYYDKIMDLLNLPSTYFRPHFYDYQIKLFYPLNKYHLFEVNTLFSGDGYKLDIDKENEFFDVPSGSDKMCQQQNMSILSMDWKWVLSNHIFSHTNVAYINNYFDSRMTHPTSHWINFDVDNLDLRNEITFLSFPHHKIETGIYLHAPFVNYTISFPRSYWNMVYHTNQNSSIRISDDSTKISTTYKVDYAYLGFSIQDEWEIVPSKLKTNFGFRVEYLNVTEELLFNPRLSLAYKIYPTLTLKFATGIYSQYSRDPLVFDPNEGNLNIKSPYAIHYIAGIEKEFADEVLFRVEAYYKNFNQLIVTNHDYEYQNSGSGFSYGFDVFLQKKLNKNWDGWLTYSYGISKRRDYKEMPLYYPIQDQRHTVSLVGNVNLPDQWKAGIKWLYNTGKPFTAIDRTENIVDPNTGDQITIPIEGPISGERFPGYSRVDLRIEKKFTWLGLKFDSYLEIINIFNTENVFDYQYNKDYSKRQASYQLPRLPVLGLNLNF